LSAAGDWSCLPWFLMKLPPRIVARCGSADCDSFMVHAWWCFTTFSCSRGKFWAMCTWNNWLDRVDQQEGLPISWFKALRFLSLGKYEFYSLYYGSQVCQGLTTVHAEWIWDDLCDLEISSKLGSHCSFVQHPAWKAEGGHFKHIL
jgi:hypothetical protein